MSFKLDTNRTYKQPVPVTVFDEDGKERSGEFTATFKVLPFDQLKAADSNTPMLDLVLVGVSDIELTNDGEPLSASETLQAVKNDPALSAATLEAYNNSISKKHKTN